MAREDGLVRDVLGDHGLAEALGGDEDAIAPGGDEVEAERGLDGGAVDARGPRPVEGVHGGEAPEAAAQQRLRGALEAGRGALGDARRRTVSTIHSLCLCNRVLTQNGHRKTCFSRSNISSSLVTWRFYSWRTTRATSDWWASC